MRKLLLIFIPFLLALLVFSLIIFMLSKNNQKGALQVTSEPESKVYLDDKPIGQTPLCKCQLKDMISSGEHTLRVVPTKGDFDAFEQKITIHPKVLTVVDRKFDKTGLGSASIISLTPIDDKKDAQISIITFPETSKVFLDNNLSGESPIILKKITESDHELKISKEGYKDKIVRIRTVLGYKLNALIFLGLNPQATNNSSQASPSATLSGKVVILETPTGFLRVRKEASTASQEIGQVKPGEVYTLLDEEDDWYRIQLNTSTSGWISVQYAEKQN